MDNANKLYFVFVKRTKLKRESRKNEERRKRAYVPF